MKRKKPFKDGDSLHHEINANKDRYISDEQLSTMSFEVAKALNLKNRWLEMAYKNAAISVQLQEVNKELWPKKARYEYVKELNRKYGGVDEVKYMQEKQYYFFDGKKDTNKLYSDEENSDVDTDEADTEVENSYELSQGEERNLPPVNPPSPSLLANAASSLKRSNAIGAIK